MASPLALLHNLSVTGKVAGLGAAGLLATSLVGGIAVAELNAIDTDNGELRADQTAYSLILSLDTRASELKVDAYKALLRPDPQGQVEELEEDVAKPRELLAELAKIPVDEAEAAAVAAIEAEYDPYIAAIESVVAGAAADQRAARADWELVQQANDKTDDVIDAAKELFVGAIKERSAVVDARSERTSRTILFVLLAGLVLVSGVAWAVSQAIIRPLRQCVQGLDAVADGDLTTRVELERADELG